MTAPCSPYSRAVIDSHLTTCSRCRRLLSDLQTSVFCPASAGEAVSLGSVEKAAKKRQKKDLLMGFVYTLFLGAGVLAVLLILQCHVSFCLPQDHVGVNHVVQLSDGTISFNLWLKDGVGWLEYQFAEDGSLYLVPKRSLFAQKEKNSIWWNTLMNSISGREPDEPSTFGRVLPSSTPGIYIGQIGQGIPIWEQGSTLPWPAAGGNLWFVPQTFTTHTMTGWKPNSSPGRKDPFCRGPLFSKNY